MKKVLFVGHTASLGGAGLCMYNLIVALQDIVLPVVILLADGELADMLRAKGIDVYIEPRIKILMPNTNSSSAWKPWTYKGIINYRKSVNIIKQYCEKIQPDIVHINTSVLMHLAIGAKKAGVKKVILHLREHWNVKWWDPRGWVRENSINDVDSIIAIAETSSLQFGFTEKTTVIYDWPDFKGRDAPLDLSEKYNIDKSKKVLLAMGGRTAIKGTDIAMMAMRYINDENIVLLVLGGKADNNPLKQKIRKILEFLHIETYGLKLDRIEKESNNRIMMTTTEKNIKDIIQQSFIILCPFTTPHFAMPALEAGCLGKPVIVSDTGYAREIVKHDKTGIIIPTCDANGLADAINVLLTSLSKIEQMGIASKQYIQKNFNKEKSLSQLIDIFT